jgi:hypothetical protein
VAGGLPPLVVDDGLVVDGVDELLLPELMPADGLLPPNVVVLPALEVPLLKPPYVVSWSPPMPMRSRPNDCQAQ